MFFWAEWTQDGKRWVREYGWSGHQALYWAANACKAKDGMRWRVKLVFREAGVQVSEKKRASSP